MAYVLINDVETVDVRNEIIPESNELWSWNWRANLLSLFQQQNALYCQIPTLLLRFPTTQVIFQGILGWRGRVVGSSASSAKEATLSDDI